MADTKADESFNVFISWSGNRSQHVAEALRDWLPLVIQAAKPFMSKADIDKGSRWLPELANVLEVTKAGIICLTPENQSAPWLLFEAGAFSKTIGSRVCTYLVAGLQPGEVVSPLGDFQHTKAEKEETRKMLQAVNKFLGPPVSERILNEAFDLAWPKLEAALDALPQPDVALPPKRKLDDMVGEILDLTRALSSARARDKAEEKPRLVQLVRQELVRQEQAKATLAGFLAAGEAVRKDLTGEALRKEIEEERKRLEREAREALKKEFQEKREREAALSGETDAAHGSEE